MPWWLSTWDKGSRQQEADGGLGVYVCRPIEPTEEAAGPGVSPVLCAGSGGWLLSHPSLVTICSPLVVLGGRHLQSLDTSTLLITVFPMSRYKMITISEYWFPLMKTQLHRLKMSVVQRTFSHHSYIKQCIYNWVEMRKMLKAFEKLELRNRKTRNGPENQKISLS